MGRSSKKALLHMQIDPAIKELLKEISARERRSMTAHAEKMLEEAIHRYIAEHGLQGGLDKDKPPMEGGMI